MLNKYHFLLIAFLAVGLEVVSAQLPGYDSLPPLPEATSPYNSKLPTKLSQDELQQLFVLHDQKKYNEYLLNNGKITREQYETNLVNNHNAISEICEPLLEGYMYLLVLGDINNGISKLWDDSWHPGWPSAKTLRERVGFNIQEPPGARITSITESTLIRITISPVTDQIYSNIKQQFEAALGVTLLPNEGYPDYNYEYTYTMPANKSGSGKAFQIILTRYTKPARIYIEITAE